MMPNILKFKHLILEYVDEMDTLQLPAMLLPEPHFRSEACAISNVKITFSDIKADVVQELIDTWRDNPASLVLASWCKVQAEAETLQALFKAAELTPKGAKTIETQL
ncbi:hypothetical protein CBER1_07580 [Cercospora berteroae]|uniref:Uncharacterized protein n=1 Tax=Cercospora berteroae TaxID=357750 RepID=A0A2S6CK14_9PEZI|nr:hypothetical protein CBER1_07580 [Cercospora berteroae]